MKLTTKPFFSRSTRPLATPLVRLCFGAILLGGLMQVLGCTATYRGGSTISPDGNYRIYGHVRGAYGHAFIDETAKKIWITIARTDNKETPLLERKYRVHGSDVGWTAIWDPRDNVTVVFFDYGPGIYWEDARKTGVEKRPIRTVTYRFDSEASSFIEGSAKGGAR